MFYVLSVPKILIVISHSQTTTGGLDRSFPGSRGKSCRSLSGPLVKTKKQ